MVIAFIAPMMMLFLFGFAVKLDIENVEMAIVDWDQSTASREFVQKLKNTDYFIDKYYVSSDQEAIDLIDRGMVKVAVIFPPEFEKDINKGKEAEVQFLIDGSDSTVSKTALPSAIMTANNYSVQLKTEAMGKRGPAAMGGKVGVVAKARVLYNQEMDSIKFTIPGLLGLVIQNITIILTAFALVRERERGTLEQLIITPIRPIELILGKLTPYVLIGFMNFGMVMTLAILVFHMDIQGSIPLLLVLSACFVICALAMGMIISTVAKTQLQAMQLALLALLPSVLLSGFVFPREAMPKPIYLMGFAIPLTYYLEIIRGIVLKGVGISYFYQQVVLLVLFTILLITVAVVRFKKRLD
jgi:ABC-2 type transport system permease protein